jgi:hypothetical protein
MRMRAGGEDDFRAKRKNQTESAKHHEYQVNFYFDKGDALAGLDVNRTYARGPVELTGFR